ncbi:hypothetical protein KP509_16G020300 [Ceratopteris richardii]|nr:hypothetical protein KP509_16G020300 [Ceratopteris richardii]
MVPPKSFSKVGASSKGNFGGRIQPASASASHTEGHCSLGSALSSLASSSANMSLQDEDFPPLQLNDNSSSTMPENIKSSAQQVSNSKSGTRSRNIHHGADEDDNWYEEGDVPDNRSSRNKKTSTRKHLFDQKVERKGSASEDRIYFLGRLLTSILRHRATELNLEVRNDGYVFVDNLLKLPIRTRQGIPLSAFTVDDVLKAVERDNKQRFGVLTENGVLLIRANQGHSIKTIESEKLLKPVLSSEEIPVCVHGTLMKNLDSILKTGLKKMGRIHIHFASGLPKEDGVISGMRHSSEVLIYLDSEKALQDGMKLFLSDNGVILTEGFDGVVPPEYFAKIATWRKGKLTPLDIASQG